MNQYKTELTRAMTMLGEDPRTIFVGQSLLYGGTGMSETFSGVPREKIIEFPVAEEMQMGICNGLALAGFIPVCVFPRWNFALLAANQIVNHLDKMGMKVIIRVGVGSDRPLNPGPQHFSDFSSEFLSMCSSIEFIEMRKDLGIVASYRRAYESKFSTILTEYMELYEV